jgi:hypothetical protein
LFINWLQSYKKRRLYPYRAKTNKKLKAGNFKYGNRKENKGNLIGFYSFASQLKYFVRFDDLGFFNLPG